MGNISNSSSNFKEIIEYRC